MSGLRLQFAYTYTDENRAKMKEYDTLSALSAYLKRQNLVETFARYAEKNGLKRRNLMIRKSHKLLERYINGRIIYNMLDDEAFIQYINEDDRSITAALKIFKDKSSFPQKNKQ